MDKSHLSSQILVVLRALKIKPTRTQHDKTSKNQLIIYYIDSHTLGAAIISEKASHIVQSHVTPTAGCFHPSVAVVVDRATSSPPPCPVISPGANSFPLASAATTTTTSGAAGESKSGDSKGMAYRPNPSSSTLVPSTWRAGGACFCNLEEDLLFLLCSFLLLSMN